MRSHRHLDQVGALIPARVPFPLVVRAAVLLVLPSQARAQDADALGARSKGSATAPVTVYEMADFQCPACRMFTVTVLPAIDSEFVKTGRVRWVFINLPLASIHANAARAAEFAMCAARQGRFWPVHDALYQQQDTWAPLPQPDSMLTVVLQRAGVDRTKLRACLADGGARKEVDGDTQRALRSGARATPSFYIEGGLLQGAPYTPDPMRHLLDSIYAVRTHSNQ